MTNHSELDDDALRSLKGLTLQLVITILVAVCLGAHALLGCCVQHIWPAGTGEVAVADGGVHDHRHHCCHEHSKPCAPTPSGPCKCECRNTCNFAPTDKVECEKPDATGFVTLLPAGDAFFEPACLAKSCESVWPAPTTALPVRLHLWNQLLLV